MTNNNVASVTNGKRFSTQNDSKFLNIIHMATIKAMKDREKILRISSSLAHNLVQAKQYSQSTIDKIEIEPNTLYNTGRF